MLSTLQYLNHAELPIFLNILLIILLFIGVSYGLNHLKHQKAKAANSGLSPSNPHPLYGSNDFEIKTTRRQQQGLTGMVFHLDVKAYIPPAQLELIHKYNLYDNVLFESGSVEHFKTQSTDTLKNLPNISDTILGLGSTKNIAQSLATDVKAVATLSKAAGYRFLSSLAFRLTVHDLIIGKTISSKNPDDLIEAETIVLETTKAFKELIERSETFTDNDDVNYV